MVGSAILRVPFNLPIYLLIDNEFAVDLMRKWHCSYPSSLLRKWPSRTIKWIARFDHSHAQTATLPHGTNDLFVGGLFHSEIKCTSYTSFKLSDTFHTSYTSFIELSYMFQLYLHRQITLLMIMWDAKRSWKWTHWANHAVVLTKYNPL